MSQKLSTTKTFNIEQSTILRTWLITLHSLAIVAAMINSFSLQYKATVIFAILISLATYLKHGGEFHRFSLRHNASSIWEIATQNENFKPFQVLPSTVLTPYIIFLHIKFFDNKKATFPIIKQALIADEFRKLLVTLKVSGMTPDS